MENSNIRFDCLRSDGRHETTKLDHLGLDEAHQLAERLLQVGNGLYAEVEIRTENGYTETIRIDDAAGANGSKVRSTLLQ
jgi:hypothetical protein